MKKILVLSACVICVFVICTVLLFAGRGANRIKLVHISGEECLLNGIEIAVDVGTSRQQNRLTVQDGKQSQSALAVDFPYSEEVTNTILVGMNYYLDTNLPFYSYYHEDETEEGTKLGSFDVKSETLAMYMDVAVISETGDMKTTSIPTDIIENDPTSGFSLYYEPVSANGNVYRLEASSGLAPGANKGDYTEYAEISINSGLFAEDSDNYYVAPTLGGDATGTFEIFVLPKNFEHGYYYMGYRIADGNLESFEDSFLQETPSTAVSLDAQDLSTHGLFIHEGKLMLLYSKNGELRMGAWTVQGEEVSDVAIDAIESHFILTSMAISGDTAVFGGMDSQVTTQLSYASLYLQGLDMEGQYYEHQTGWDETPILYAVDLAGEAPQKIGETSLENGSLIGQVYYTDGRWISLSTSKSYIYGKNNSAPQYHDYLTIQSEEDVYVGEIVSDAHEYLKVDEMQGNRIYIEPWTVSLARVDASEEVAS